MITAADYQRAKEIVADALELPVAERGAFLESKCADAPELRAEVESLLSVDLGMAGGAGFLSSPARLPADTTGVLAEPDSALAGQTVGAWRLVREVGRGGMGVVYLADRADGAYQQQAAIKLLRGAGRQDATRMARERQALAGLNHPNIARLIDGGTAADGTPYLVMEYVEGSSIDRYSLVHHLSLAKRVALVQKICSALQSAHQQLLIHRDIKPSNILIDPTGEPKLLDFGIARLLEGEGIQDLTHAGALLFTPRYASPEQVKGQTVSVATDVYGLGALLYALLAGSSPYPRMSTTNTTNVAAVMRVVVEDDVADASTLAAVYQSAFSHELKGDLDIVLAKACAKNPLERYPTVAALADDLQRWQNGQPITAKKLTWGYVTRKFIGRHKLLTTVSVALVLLTVAGTSAVAWQASIAERERALAEKRFGDVRTLAGKILFDYYDDVEKLQNSLAMREKLAKDSVAYLDALAVDAGGNAGLLKEVADGYERLGAIYGRTWSANKGEPEVARRHFKQALALREAAFKADPLNVTNAASLASTLQEMADVENAAGTSNDALPLISRGIAVLEPAIEKAGVQKAIAAANILAKLYRLRGEVDSCAGSNTRGHSAQGFNFLASKADFFKALASAQATDTDAQSEYASSLIETGMAGACRGEFASAYAGLGQSLTILSTLASIAKNPVPYQMLIPMAEIELASIYSQQGDFANAILIAQRAYHHLAPFTESSNGDAGAQLQILLVLTKTANYMMRAGREQDRRDVVPYLRQQRETATTLLKLMPSNQFAITLARSGRNMQNMLMAQIDHDNAISNGNGNARAISAQLALIGETETSANQDSVQALALQARLYAGLARMYTPAGRATACQALEKSLAISMQIIARDREVIRYAVDTIEDAALAHEWQLNNRACGADSHRAEAIKLADDTQARGVKHLMLAGMLARLKR